MVGEDVIILFVCEKEEVLKRKRLGLFSAGRKESGKVSRVKPSFSRSCVDTSMYKIEAWCASPSGEGEATLWLGAVSKGVARHHHFLKTKWLFAEETRGYIARFTSALKRR